MASPSAHTGRPGQAQAGPIRVMVVDDSAVVRGLVSRMLEEDPAIQVVSSVGNGQMALQGLDRHEVDVVILDIEMPVMDGLTALPLLLRKSPGLKVVISSTLTLKNAEVSLKALEMGASEYLTKPSSSRDISGGTDFRQELISKVQVLGRARHRDQGRGSPAARQTDTRARTPIGSTAAPAARAPAAPISLRSPSSERPDVIAIGSSTGGPQALFTVFGDMRKGGAWPSQPILITQHMPATFTTILAGHISRASGLEAAEGKDGDVIKGGQVYVAPGDYHMVVEGRGTQKVIRLNQNPPENFCRPSVDPMFRSIASVYGRRTLGVILTGMGSDGTKGGAMIVEAGGTIIAQDEATSVVWGMPGAVAQAGLCTAVLPIGDIGPYISRIASKR